MVPVDLQRFTETLKDDYALRTAALLGKKVNLVLFKKATLNRSSGRWILGFLEEDEESSLEYAHDTGKVFVIYLLVDGGTLEELAYKSLVDFERALEE